MMLLFPEKESKISSLVEYLILLALKKEGKQRGVDIINKISAQFQNWTPQSGTIYPVLNRLVKKGFVSQPEKKIYQITETGEAILKEYLRTFIDTIIFIDTIFNYGRFFMDNGTILQSEAALLQNHMPYVKTLIEDLPMARQRTNSSETYLLLTKMRDLLHDTLQSIDMQIDAIKEEDKVVRVKIK
jgi:DNA-binding PadR family transcriptional regulator